MYDDMRMREFVHILDELKGIRVLCPHGYGEPLLHSGFLEMMREVHRRGIKIHLVTNGLLLTLQIAESFLKECDPYGITFSVDAGEAESYESIRIGASFSTLLENVRTTVEARNRLNPSTKIIFHCVIGSHNINQIEPLSRLAWQLGVDLVEFDDITLYNVGPADEDHAIRTTGLIGLVNQRSEEMNAKYAPKTRIHFSDPTAIVNCPLPWTQVFVEANGDVCGFGCADLRSPSVSYLGNIHRMSFKKMWNGDKMQRTRLAFATATVPKDWCCYKCTLYTNPKRW